MLQSRACNMPPQYAPREWRPHRKCVGLASTNDQLYLAFNCRIDALLKNVSSRCSDANVRQHTQRSGSEESVTTLQSRGGEAEPVRHAVQAGPAQHRHKLKSMVSGQRAAVPRQGRHRLALLPPAYRPALAFASFLASSALSFTVSAASDSAPCTTRHEFSVHSPSATSILFQPLAHLPMAVHLAMDTP